MSHPIPFHCPPLTHGLVLAPSSHTRTHTHTLTHTHTHTLSRTHTHILTPYLAGCRLKEFIHLHQQHIQETGSFNVDAALNALTIQEIEDVGVPVQFGFRSRLEYYEHASSLQ
jgi:predicted alpha/beta-fold hydrolase